MDPISLAAISMGATALGSGVQAYGQLYAGKANAAQMRYQAGVSDVNRIIASQNKDYALQSGEYSAQQYGAKARFQQGKLLATQGASGVDVGFGSAVETRESMAHVARVDQRMIRRNAALKAWGYDIEGVKHEAEGNLLRAGAKQSEKAGKIGAIASILGGASSVSNKWMQANTLGVNLGGASGPPIDEWAYGSRANV